MEAIVLAGGLGTRLRSIVADVPKPMAPVHGRPFLEYLLRYWTGQGVTRFVLSVGYKNGVIRRHFGSRYGSAALTYAVEPRPLGTGGGLLLAARRLKGSGSVLVLNGDTWFEVALAELKGAHARRGARVTVALTRAPSPGRYGRVTMDERGAILAFQAEGEGTAGGLANGGVYLFDADVLRGLEETWSAPVSLEHDILPWLLQAGGRVYGFPSRGRFIDIGLPDDYRRAASVLVPGAIPRPLDGGRRP